MIKLLIVDDEPRTRKGLVNIISKSSLPVEIVGISPNGTDALEKTRESLPDIIITDIRMPKMDGIEFSSEVRKFHPSCQIIFISSYSDKEYLRSAITLKAVNYVEKPFEAEEMLEAIQTAIDIVIQNRSLYLAQKDILKEKLALELLCPNMNEVYWEKMHSILPEFTNNPCFCTVICPLAAPKSGSNYIEIPHSQIQKCLNEVFPYSLSAQKEPNIFVMHLSHFAANHSAAMRNLMNQL